MDRLGETIEIFLMDGETSGRWKAKLSNWNGVAYKIPRKMFKECEKIEELKAPGVYFLFGLNNDSEGKFVYVGESDTVLTRIMQPHVFEKDGSFWTEAVIFLTPDETLDKAKVKYLENRFHEIVMSSGRYVVKNGNTPKQSPVKDTIKSMLEKFIVNTRLVMPSLGHDVFEPQPSDYKEETGDLLYLSRNNGKGGKAEGRIENDGFWVLKGSYIFPETASYLPSGVLKLREKYKNKIDKNGILQINVCFGSPSYAASFVCGKNTNGLNDWKDKNGKSLKELNVKEDKDSEETKPKKKSEKNKRKEKNIFHIKGTKCKASAYLTKDGIVVMKGSEFSPLESNSCGEWIKKHRKELIKSGKVLKNVFNEDVIFSSSSLAAACVLGRNVNGRTAWVNGEGKTIKDIENMS